MRGFVVPSVVLSMGMVLHAPLAAGAPRISPASGTASLEAAAIVSGDNAAPTAEAGPEQTVGLVSPGRIVVNHDEWTLSDTGLGQAPTGAQFALNVASLFAGGEPGHFLVYSTNFGLTQADLRNTMEAAGHTWTVSTSAPFTVPSLLEYDGVFLAANHHSGSAISQAVLIDYVHAGGNVYLAGGTDRPGPAEEAAQWNTFLKAFGLHYEPVYNWVMGAVAVASSADDPLLAGVASLYYNRGNSVTILAPGDPRVRMPHQRGTDGLVAVFEGTPDTGRATVTLDGSATDDGLPEGSTLTVKWTQVSGPGAVVFADPTSASTTATFDTAGVYVLRLTANDGELEDEDDVGVTVIPGPAVR